MNFYFARVSSQLVELFSRRFFRNRKQKIRKNVFQGVPCIFLWEDVLREALICSFFTYENSLLKILQYSQENIESLLNKACNFVKKRLQQKRLFSCEYCKMLKTPILKLLQTAVSSHHFTSQNVELENLIFRKFSLNWACAYDHLPDLWNIESHQNVVQNPVRYLKWNVLRK